MSDLARLAKHPALAGYFALVHPFFWPVLLWYLRKVAAQVDAAGRDGALIRITWWGGVYLEYLGDRADTWKKPALTRALWSDPVRETHLPENLADLVMVSLHTNEIPHATAQSYGANTDARPGPAGRAPDTS